MGWRRDILGRGTGERLRPALTVARSLPWPEGGGDGPFLSPGSVLSPGFHLGTLLQSVSLQDILSTKMHGTLLVTSSPSCGGSDTLTHEAPLTPSLHPPPPCTQLPSRFTLQHLPPAEVLGFSYAFGGSEEKHLKAGPLLYLVLLPVFRRVPGT